MDSALALDMSMYHCLAELGLCVCTVLDRVRSVVTTVYIQPLAFQQIGFLQAEYHIVT